MEIRVDNYNTKWVKVDDLHKLLLRLIEEKEDKECILNEIVKELK
jgi:hypothetical protein